MWTLVEFVVNNLHNHTIGFEYKLWRDNNTNTNHFDYYLTDFEEFNKSNYLLLLLNANKYATLIDFEFNVWIEEVEEAHLRWSFAVWEMIEL